MTKPHSVYERALFTGLMLVLPTGLLLASPSLASSETAAAPLVSAAAPAEGADTVYNQTFEFGTKGWSTSRRTRLTQVKNGRGSSAAVRLHARRPGSVMARATASARRLVGSEHVVSAWLRSPRGVVPARLVVKEVEPATGRTLSTEGDRIKVGPVWKRASVDIVRSSETSVLTVEVRARQSRKDRILLDDVKIRRRAGSVPTPKPTPKPTPTATPTAVPDDTAGILSNGCTFSTRGLPSCGSYMGAAYGSNTDPAPMEAATGARLGVRRTYFQGSQVDKAVAVSKSDIAAGRLPWISFKMPMSWEDMAAGKGDAWALDLAHKLAALDGPVWVAFHHEPEKDGNILAWRAMQERLAPLVRSAAPNVAYTVITTGWNQLYGPAEYQLDNIWPRNVKIDVAGFDVYNFHLTTRSDGSKLTKPDRIKSDYFDKLGSWAKANNTTWALAETGQTDESFALDPDWIPRTHAEMTATGGVAMAYFNTALNSGGNSFPVASQAKIAAFAAAQQQAPVLPRR
ncbi:hypothetical protein [Nocardioides houyundeii]|uniref:hypothetical protein n=1 Tax=Nocardioides houyundeii TaxID=2045452 RepID=UPI001315A56E|nr:hypothetical protein [Nocardioides houyundeii]